MRIDLQTKVKSHHGWSQSHMAIVDQWNGLVTIMIGNGSGQATSLLTTDEARIVAASIMREVKILEQESDRAKEPI